MASPIKFGTDGWRGVIAEDFTFDNVRLCAQAVADYLKRAGLASRGLVIGCDTRFASEDFAAATAEVVAANDIRVYLCPGATPTPVVSFGVVHQKAGAGVVITASHNPPIWNGFKVKSAHGASAPSEIIAELEKNVQHIIATGEVKRMPLGEARGRGLVQMLDLAPAYTHRLAGLVDLEGLRGADLEIVVDSMYGAGVGYLRKLLEGGRLRVTEMNAERNPTFPGIERPEPIAPNLTRLSARVRRIKAALGLATDGDADRVGIIDENGAFLTQLEVFALLCLYLLEVRGQRGPIVKTVTTTSMVYRLGELFKVPVYETAVGFKYVAPLMMEKDALIGGEESGGYGFRGHVPERDGILAALYFLDLVVRTGKTPAQLLEYLFQKVGPHHYQRLDVTFPADQRQTVQDRLRRASPPTIDGVKVARADTTDGFRFTLADNTWLLIRFSGTEPLLRIYAESISPDRASKTIAAGKELAGL